MMMTCVLRFSALAGALLVTFPAFAGVIGSVPKDGPMPNYFSGANCRASARAYVTYPTAGLLRMEFYIGSELVMEQDFPYLPGKLYVAEVTPQVRFDSTHFPHGTNLEIDLRVWTTDNEWYSFTGWAEVKNVGVVYGHYDFEGPTGAAEGTYVRGQLLQMNHDVSRFRIDNSWTRADLKAEVSFMTAFHIGTHGDVVYYPPGTLPPGDRANYLLDNFAAPLFALSFMHPDWNAEDPRVSAVGSGALPPFNSGQPPVNIAFINACCTGLHNDWAEALLWPYQNAYVPWPECQAEVGWRFYVDNDGAIAAGKRFWDTLRAGYTVVQAREMAVAAYNNVMTEQGFPHVDPTDLTVYGDHYARLHSVYTGDASEPVSWWRPE